MNAVWWTQDLWPYLSGKSPVSPRTEVFADNAVLVMEIKGHKWKLFGSQTPDADPDEYHTTHADGKVGVGVACWMGPQYPCACPARVSRLCCCDVYE